MANVVLPQVSILNNLANDANLLVEQNGEINRFAVTDLDIGGGDVTIDLASGISSAANPIDADTLNGYEFNYFASKNDLSDYATAEQVEEIIANLPKEDLDIKLNYSVVGGTTQPTNPTENMIWVNTDQEITGHIFRNIEPLNPYEGMVWLITADSSSAPFDRLLLNNVCIDEIYPVGAQQYINGVFTDVNVKFYQNNQWIDWIIYLFRYGKQTYDWQSRALQYMNSSSHKGAAPTVTVNADGSITLDMYVSGSSTMCGGCYELKTDFDLTNINKLKVKYKNSNGTYLSVVNRNSYWSDYLASVTLASGTIEAELDVSNLTGKYDIMIYLYRNNNNSGAGTETITLEEVMAIV